MPVKVGAQGIEDWVDTISQGFKKYTKMSKKILIIAANNSNTNRINAWTNRKMTIKNLDNKNG